MQNLASYFSFLSRAGLCTRYETWGTMKWLHHLPGPHMTFLWRGVMTWGLCRLQPDNSEPYLKCCLCLYPISQLPTEIRTSLSLSVSPPSTSERLDALCLEHGNPFLTSHLARACTHFMQHVGIYTRQFQTCIGKTLPLQLYLGRYIYLLQLGRWEAMVVLYTTMLITHLPFQLPWPCCISLTLLYLRLL